MLRPALLLLGASLSLTAAASEIRGTVKPSVGGAPKADASGVVILVADVPLPARARPPAEMAQLGKQFTPQVLAVPVGTRVSFPNRDPIEHNVFSRSPHGGFDLGRYGPGPGKARVFDGPGVVDVFCNVHSTMVGHVVVVPGPWAVTGPDGRFAIAGLPPGPHQLVIWDRFARPAVRRLEADAGAELRIAVDESAGEPPHPNKFGGAYRTQSY